MRFMIMGKATKESEAGIMPKPEAFEAMGQYNDDLVKAGILLAAEGLAPTSLAEAIEVVKRTPNIFPNGEAEVEIRKLMDIEDFGDGFTPNPDIAEVKFK